MDKREETVSVGKGGGGGGGGREREVRVWDDIQLCVPVGFYFTQV